MSAEQLATRILSEQAEIGSEKIRRGMIDENEFKKLVQVSQEMAQIPLYIDQMGGITIAQVAARARKLKRQKGLGLDHRRLSAAALRRRSNSQANRVQEITQITTGLKALAKELQVPVIALSQLSRAVEQREDKRPQLSDLRESGSIEQDADVVMFVFREEYYVERTKPHEGTPEFSGVDGQDAAGRPAAPKSSSASSATAPSAPSTSPSTACTRASPTSPRTRIFRSGWSSSTMEYGVAAAGQSSRGWYRASKSQLIQRTSSRRRPGPTTRWNIGALALFAQPRCANSRVRERGPGALPVLPGSICRGSRPSPG